MSRDKSEPRGTNLVIVSHAFAPSVGGVETVSRILAEQITAAGHRVTVLTTTPQGTVQPRVPYTIVRNPTLSALLHLLHDADAVIESHITLGLTWPLYLGRLLHLPTTLGRKRLVSVMHTPELRPGRQPTRANWLKLWILRHTRPYAVSEYLLRSQQINGQLMPNPYDDKVFQPQPVERQPDSRLLFVGRLTAAKGCDVAISALAELNGGSAVEPGRELFHLDIVGHGEEEPNLREQAISVGQQAFVHFLGSQTGFELASTFSTHRIVLLPSRSCPPEAFPLVALEAAACGAIPIGSRQGGLPDAIGPCGVTFPEGVAHALARAILNVKAGRVLLDAERIRAHLEQHAPARVAQRYLAAAGVTEGPATQGAAQTA